MVETALLNGSVPVYFTVCVVIFSGKARAGSSSVEASITIFSIYVVAVGLDIVTVQFVALVVNDRGEAPVTVFPSLPVKVTSPPLNVMV